jgi:hypothetical protein
MKPDPTRSPARIDPLTTAGIGICIYFLSVLLHEGAHAASAFLSGAQSLTITSFDVEYLEPLDGLHRRITSGAGIVESFILAGLILLVLPAACRRRTHRWRWSGAPSGSRWVWSPRWSIFSFWGAGFT